MLGAVGLTQASVSRALFYLSETDWHDTSKPGLNLVVRRVSARDARQRVVELSPRGRKLASRLEAVLGELRNEVA
jgi:DNA-binding MarR family transcriptional regulator